MLPRQMLTGPVTAEILPTLSLRWVVGGGMWVVVVGGGGWWWGSGGVKSFSCQTQLMLC